MRLEPSLAAIFKNRTQVPTKAFRSSFVGRVLPFFSALRQENARDVCFEIGRQRLPEYSSFIDRVQELLQPGPRSTFRHLRTMSKDS